MAKTRNQSLLESLALAYASGTTIKAWADANQISPNTCYHWTKDAEFKRLVAEYRSQMIQACLGQLIKGSSTAAAQIVTLVEKAENESTRLAACRTVLEHLVGLTQFANLQEQIEALKAEVSALKGGDLAIHRPVA